VPQQTAPPRAPFESHKWFL